MACRSDRNSNRFHHEADETGTVEVRTPAMKLIISVRRIRCDRFRLLGVFISENRIRIAKNEVPGAIII